MIRLVRPTEAMKEQAIEFRQEFFEHGEFVINGSELFDKAEMLRQLLEVAKKAGMNELYLSVERKNEPSVKTITRNGGVYERSFEIDGEQADIYRIALSE